MRIEPDLPQVSGPSKVVILLDNGRKIVRYLLDNPVWRDENGKLKYRYCIYCGRPSGETIVKSFHQKVCRSIHPLKK